MPNWSEKDTDKLFQQGSEQYDFEYDPAAWGQMEALLERAERRRRWLWWLFIAGLCVAVVVGVYSLSGNGFAEGEQTTPKGAANEAAQPQPAPDNAQEQPLKTEETAPTTIEKPQTKNGETKKRGDKLPHRSMTEEAQEESVQRPSPPSAMQGAAALSEKKRNLENGPPAVAETGGHSAWNPSGNIPSPEGQAERPAQEVVLAGTHPAQKDEQAVPPVFGFSILPARAIYVRPLRKESLGKAKTAVLPLTVPPSGNETGEARKPNSRHAFLVGIASGLERNSVGFGDFSRQNWKLGAFAEYRFRQRFAVGLGGHFLRMDYLAGRGEYVVGDGFWVDGIKPQSTRGLCDMLEIPLEASYYFRGFRQDGFFATAGLSSYWILEEHYWYNYDAPRPDLVFYWGTQKDERNWLNLGLVSFGFQQKLSQRLSLSAAPYAQFPLTGVGHGGVRIYSLGLRARLGFWASRM